MVSMALEVNPQDSVQGSIIPKDTTDEQFIDMWIERKKSSGTRKAYRSDIDRFLAYVQFKPLRMVNFFDLQAYQKSLEGLSQSTINRRLAVVKSLFSLAVKMGYLPVNMGSFLDLEKVDSDRAKRIIGEADVMRMIDHETNTRNHALLHLLYHAGLRISEIVNLQWADLVMREDGGQISVLGKRDKRRYILLGQAMYAELMALPHKSMYVFTSRQSDQLTIDMVSKIVHTAAKRVGLSGDVSPHWMRHSHASHALDHGAPVHLVMETLGHESLATTSIYSHAKPGASSSQFLLV